MKLLPGALLEQEPQTSNKPTNHQQHSQSLAKPPAAHPAKDFPACQGFDVKETFLSMLILAFKGSGLQFPALGILLKPLEIQSIRCTSCRSDK